MLSELQVQQLNRDVRVQLQNIRHDMKIFQYLSGEISSLTNQQITTKNILNDKNQKIKNQIKDKIKNISNNIEQIGKVINWKVLILTKNIAKLDENKIGNSNTNKNNSNTKSNNMNTKTNNMNTKSSNMNTNNISQSSNSRRSIFQSKSQQLYKYQINQLQQRIIQLQKKQNQYVKQISMLKQKHCKLRQDFNNYSFDSNQRIKQLSQKLHNNTSPNLTINRIMSNQQNQKQYNTKDIYKIDNNKSVVYSDDQPKSIMLIKNKNNSINSNNNNDNNFVKLKSTNINQFNQNQDYYYNHDNNNLQSSPVSYTKKSKPTNNILDSFLSDDNDIDNYHNNNKGIEIINDRQNKQQFRFGCFPTKQSQKTKTGSTSQNKRMNFQQKYDKNRRFQFLLNNLIDDKNINQNNISSTKQSYPSPIQNNKFNNNTYNYNNNNNNNNQQIFTNNKDDNQKSVFSQNVVKRYQI